METIRGFINILFVFAVFGTLMPAGLGQRPPVDQEHIRRLIQSLPEDNRLRRDLEAGNHGDGVHYPWMDEMQRVGVRLAEFSVERRGRNKPGNVRILHIVYFSDYEENCAQIADPERLVKIRTSGLEAELSKVAVQRMLVEPILSMDREHRKGASGVIKLFADEWIPHVDGLVPGTYRQTPIEQAIDMNDVAGLIPLLRSGVSPNDLGTSMWVTYADDNPCMMKALLEAGGNINLTDREGRTILMEAVRSNATRIARMLVAAGADVNARSSRNETALSIARSEHNEAMVSLLKRAGAGD